MPATLLPSYDDLPLRLNALRGQAGAALDEWARSPRVVSSQGTHLKFWLAAYVLRCAVAEQNPAWGRTLAGALGLPPLPGQGLPARPPAVYWAVDEAGPGLVTLSVDVAGALTAEVHLVGSKDPVLTPAVTPGATRQTLTFKAVADGFYAVRLLVGTTALATLYVPVVRAEWRNLREAARQLGYPYAATLPRPDEGFRLRLALLATLEAAARTGQLPLAQRLLAALRKLPALPTPVALFPRPRHD